MVLATSQVPRARNAPTDRARAARGASRARRELGTPGQVALGAGLLGAPAHPHGVGRTRGQLTHDLAQSTGGLTEKACHCISWAAQRSREERNEEWLEPTVNFD